MGDLRSLASAFTRGLHSDATTSRALFLCALGLGGFLLWAGLVPLDEGVVARGRLVVENKRRTVQHLEGGIVARLLVREGQVVREGQPLLELESLGARAARDQITQLVASLQAAIDRLDALARGDAAIRFSAHPAGVGAEPFAAAQQRELALLRRQLASLAAESSVLRGRKAALLARADALGGRLAALRSLAAASEAELAIKRPLLETRDVTIDEIQRLERELHAHEAEYAQSLADRQHAQAEAAQVDRELAQLQARVQEEAASESAQKQAELHARLEELAARQDIVERTQIAAPVGGTVMNLAVTTLGGVVRPAEPLLEIVPDREGVVAQVELSPAERDSVVEDMAVHARVLAFDTWKTPVFEGRVLSVSADLVTDRESGASYYQATVMLDARSLPPDAAIALEPGLPVEVFVASGVQRTFLAYLVEPVLDVMRNGLGRT